VGSGHVVSTLVPTGLIICSIPKIQMIQRLAWQNEVTFQVPIRTRGAKGIRSQFVHFLTPTISNMYLFACKIMIKMKWFFSTSNHKILYLTTLIVCRRNPIQSYCTDCKIIIIEGEEIFFWGVPRLLLMFWNSIEIK
jgi:hypothetical protein